MQNPPPIPPPPGWSALSPQPPPPPHLVVSKHTNVGLYSGDADLRHFGEAQLFLTETTIVLFFQDVKPDPKNTKPAEKVGNLEFISTGQNQNGTNNNNNSFVLLLELQLSSIESHKWLSGFAMFSSPKIQLVLKKVPAPPKLSFRNGGIDEFVKHLDVCLKKKSWLTIVDPSKSTMMSNNNNIVGATAASAVASSSTTTTTTTITTSTNNNANNNNNSSGNPDSTTSPTTTTTRAGLAGILARQNERTTQLQQTIKQSTNGEVDDLIIKSKELQALMDRFRQELAKGDYKLCQDQIDHLKKLDARFALGAATTASVNQNTATSTTASSSTPAKNQNNNHNSSSSKEIANELVRFIQHDSVISSTVRVPLVELFAAFNVSRGFGLELSPSEFHDALSVVVVKNFPEKRILNLIISRNVAATPSFSLKGDHLIQFHVLASQLALLESVLGPQPFFSQTFRKVDSELVSRVVKNHVNKSISILQCSKLLRVPADEARELLLQLEIEEGVLMRDEHSSVGIRFSWNLFAIV
jgi:hypothetical protein